MVVQLRYGTELEESESEILRKFGPIIAANWVQHARSTASLEWIAINSDTEPKRLAVLRVRGNRKEIMRESIWSFERKSLDQFKNEFIENAMRYSNENPS